MHCPRTDDQVIEKVPRGEDSVSFKAGAQRQNRRIQSFSEKKLQQQPDFLSLDSTPYPVMLEITAEMFSFFGNGMWEKFWGAASKF